MNFLAHIYLSGDFNEVMIGNFIGDYVKGRQLSRFTPGIQQGILLHRKIDSFTDSHPVVKQSAQRFKSCYQRYASVVIDVVYDHFLASLWDSYSKIPLNKFVDHTHSFMLKNYFNLPGRVKGFLPFLIKSRRLENYKHIWGIEKSLEIMANYSSLPAQSSCAIKVLSDDYEALQEEFISFFNDLRTMVNYELSDKSISFHK